jgi:hypothetical protein
MFEQFLPKVWAIIEPAALLVITALVGLAVAKVVQWCNDQRKGAAIVQAVAATEQMSLPGTANEEKLATALQMIDSDPRVKNVTPEEVEAAVFVTKAAVKPCPPGDAGE